MIDASPNITASASQPRIDSMAYGDSSGDSLSTMLECSSRRNRILDALEIVLPVLVGGFIYIAWRGTNLRMFNWANGIGAVDAVATLRAVFGSWRLAMPGIIINSVPDALWAYSFARFHYVLYLRGERAAWLAVAPAVTLGSEVGQAIGIVPGTFDWCDLLLCGTAVLMAFHPWRTR